MEARAAFRLILSAILIAILSVPAMKAQDAAYWIFLRDKGPGASVRLDRLTPAQAGLTGEAVARRAQAFGSTPAEVLDMQDLPLYDGYISELVRQGVALRASSRWQNAVSARLSPEQLGKVAGLPFVLHIEAVRKRNVRPDPPAGPPPVLLRRQQSHDLNYGIALQQLETMRVPKVHDVWIDGTGIIVGMLDNGFRWRDHEALGTRNVRGEYDFVNRDSVTENQPGDLDGQDAHGTATFSALAAFRDGILIGPAYNASYFLAKTERNGSETQDEEDFWVEGIEWLESRGAAVVSSSLAYDTFDDGSGYRYENGDFDGKTAITTRAAVRAMRLGVVVVNAMGNEGNSPGTILAPADADSIISVGASNYDLTVAGFSSNGPTNDDRVKPDVIAPGVSVAHATKYGPSDYSYSSGTSLATPLTAGVAALVRSARPELSAVQVRNALRATADRATMPNSSYGWGVIDAWNAVLLNGMVISTNPREGWNDVPTSVAAYVLSPNTVNKSSVRLHYQSDGGGSGTEDMRFEEQYVGLGTGSGRYSAIIPVSGPATVRYYIEATDGKETRTSPYGAPEKRHELVLADIPPQSFTLFQNYPNPFSARTGSSTNIRFDVPRPGGFVRLEVYDMLGRRVRTLWEGDAVPGTHVASFFAGDLATGPYIYALASGGETLYRHMIFVR